ncbi:hypothetical protein BJX65DRAFT_311531 [Aspergillus insuetus]
MGGPTYLDNAEVLGKSILLLSNCKNPFDIDKLLEGVREVIKLNDAKKTVGESQASPSPRTSTTPASTQQTTTRSASKRDPSLATRSTAMRRSARATLYYTVPDPKIGLHHPSAVDCDEFLDFYKTWGTNVIPSCTFGARYHLKLESYMSRDLSKEDFETHIKAEYHGVASVRIRGGDISKNASLAQSPDVAAKFSAWCASIKDATANDLLTFGVKSIGDMVNESGGMESKERKKLPASVEIEIQGPPGIEVDYPVIERKTKSHKKSSTHFSFEVFFRKTDEATRVRHIRVCGPPPSVKIVCQTPDHTMVAWYLKCGADVLFTGKETSGEIEVPNLFEEVMYPRYRSG